MSDLYQRYGILCDSRKCPRHHQAMEIATDFSAADCVATTLQWWCETCRGYWSELYFERQAESQDKTMMGFETNLELECPDCGSKDVGRQCHFRCCDNFICRNCQLNFGIAHEILEASPLVEDEIHELQFEGVHSSENREYITPIVHPVTIETDNCAYEFCEHHPDRPVTLVENPNRTDERHRFSWICIDCPPDEAKSERVSEFMRTKASTFFRRSQSPYQCRICHHAMFSGGMDSLRCDTCGTMMKLTMIKNGSAHFDPPCSSCVTE